MKTITRSVKQLITHRDVNAAFNIGRLGAKVVRASGAGDSLKAALLAVCEWRLLKSIPCQLVRGLSADLYECAEEATTLTSTPNHINRKEWNNE